MNLIKFFILLFLLFFVQLIQGGVRITGNVPQNDENESMKNTTETIDLDFESIIVYVEGHKVITAVNTKGEIFVYGWNSEKFLNGSKFESISSYPVEKTISNDDSVLILFKNQSLSVVDISEYGTSEEFILPHESINHLKIVDIAIGNKASLILDEDGNVYSSGLNSNYVLCAGDESEALNRDEYDKIVSDDDKKFHFITMSDYASFMIDSTNKTFVCGKNNGQLGELDPLLISASKIETSFSVVSVSSIGNITYLLSSNGEAYKNENDTFYMKDRNLFNNESLVMLIALFNAGAALTENGVLYYWGDGDFNITLKGYESIFPPEKILNDTLYSFISTGNKGYNLLSIKKEEAYDLELESCPEGYFCPIKTLKRFCPFNTWSKPNSTSLLDCNIPCPEGFLCKLGKKYECIAGTACSNNILIECKNHEYTSNNKSSQCKICHPGNYTTGDDLGNTACNICPIGSYCYDGIKLEYCQNNNFTNITGQSECFECPIGSYISDSNEGGNSECSFCPKGKYCPNGINSIICNENNYTNITGQSECFECLIGSYTSDPIEDGNTECNFCPKGKFCPNGKDSYFCSGKNYTSSINQTECLVCNPGSYIKFQVDGGNIECSYCEIRNYCPDGIYSIICNENNYTNITGQSECFECPIGSYISDSNEDGNSECSFCPKGKYCPNGINSIICNENNYTNITGQSECFECLIGSYTSDPIEDGNTECNFCPKGKFCPNGKDSNICSQNYFANITGLSECYICENGGFTSESEVGKGNTICSSCPKGSYCVDGNSFLCKGSNYSVSGQSECSLCENGRFTTEVNVDEGNTICSDCNIGYYCPDGDSEFQCTGNNYSTTQKKSSCDECPPGSYISNSQNGTNIECSQCDAGFYCDGVSMFACNGTNYTSTTNQFECQICPSGSYISDKKIINDLEVHLNCSTCSNGSYCPNGIDTFLCIKSNYSSNEGSFNCLQCSIGSYTTESISGQGNTQCHICPKGSYCQDGNVTNLCIGYNFTSDPGKSLCGICNPGYFTSKISDQGNSKCEICQDGYYCPDGDLYLPCIDNNYTSTPGNQFCNICPSGNYTNSLDQIGNNECIICPIGFYCQDGNMKLNCTTFNYTLDEGQASCFICPSGHYTNLSSTGDGNNLCTICPVGASCPGNGSLINCQGSYYSNAQNLSSCILCPMGSYTSKDSIDNCIDCNLCPLGTYCPNGESIIVCDTGSFTNQNGSSSSSQCSTQYCPPKHSCNGGIATPNPPNNVPETADTIIWILAGIIFIIIFLIILIFIIVVSIVITISVIFSNRKSKYNEQNDIELVSI